MDGVQQACRYNETEKGNRMYRLDWPDRAILGEGEIPADPALPQLATLLDERAMGRILQVELPGGVLEGRYSIERCRIARVRQP